MKRIAMAAALAVLACARAHADSLIDDFDQENAGISDTFGNIAFWDSAPAAPNRWIYIGNLIGYGGANPFPVQTTRARTNSGGGVGFSDGDAFIASGAPGVGQYIRATSFRGGFPGLSNSDCTTPSLKLETVMATLVRDFNDGQPFDASAFKYLRFTAWREPDDLTNPQPARRKYLQPGTEFYVAMADSAFGFSTGPQSGGQIDGLTLGLTPQAFIIDLSTLAGDPIFSQLGASQINPADLSLLAGIAFGYRHEGPNTDPLNSGLFIHPDFFVDDVYLLDAPPSISVTGVDFVLDEAVANDSLTLEVVLTAIPTGDVTLTISSTDPSQGTIASGPITFTQSDWNVPQQVVVQVVDDLVADGNVQFNAQFAVSSVDVFYASLNGQTSPAITALDNDQPVLSDDVLIDNFDAEAAGIVDTFGNTAIWDTTPALPQRWTYLLNTTGYGGANPFPPQTTRLRTTDTPGIAPSDGDAFVEDAGSPGNFHLRGTIDRIGVTGLANSLATTPTLKLEGNLLSVNRNIGGAAMDASAFRYVRFTAWRDPDAPLPHTTNKKYLQPGTEFCVGLVDSGLQVSTGPQSGGEIVGLPITTQPQVFVVDLAALGADPVFGDPQGIGLPAADLTQLGALAFGFRHEGPNTDPINSGIFVHPDFYVDDVYLLHNAPGLVIGGADFTLDEGINGDALSLTLTLSAEPTGDVTVSALSLDPSEGTVLGGPYVFTPANWNTPQSVVVQVADDLLFDGPIPFQIEFTAASSDLAYAALAPSLSPTLVTLDNEGATPNAADGWSLYD